MDRLPIIFKDSVAATVSLLLIGSSGVYLVHQNILNKEKLSVLSKLVEQLFTPCLIFASFIKSLEIEDVGSWLPVTLISCVSILQGCLLGKLANKYFLKDAHYEPLIVLSCGLAMTTNIQLNVSHNLRDYLDNISLGYTSTRPSAADGESRAITYIMIYTFVNTIGRWTFAKDMMVRTKQQAEDIQLALLESQAGQGAAPPGDQPEGGSAPGTRLAAKKREEKGFDFSELYKNPPLVSTFLAFLIVLVPFIKSTLNEKGGFFHRAVFISIQSLGQAQPPVTLMVLGGTLYLNRNTASRISRKTLVGITVVRLIINPLVGALVLHFIWGQHLLLDPVQLFICLISYSSPTAINLLLISTLYGDCAFETSQILLFGYLAYILTLPIVMMLLFYFMG